MKTRPQPGRCWGQAVTSRQIAQHAGVSQTTVSLVLNDRAARFRISPRTQQRILTAARELGYQSNYLARGLKGASTRSVGIVWSLVSTPHSARLVSGLAKRIGDRGYVCYVADLVNDSDRTIATLRDFRSRRVDAVILHSTKNMFDDNRIDRELSAFPAAVVVSDTPHLILHDLVVHDRLGAYRQAAAHFARAGRRRPVIIGNVASNERKFDAFNDELRRRGLAVDRWTALDVPSRGDQVLASDCYAALDKRAEQGPDFDAAMCTSDDLALATLAWLRRHGRIVPDDVAVVGFDNTQVSPYTDPPLASVQRHDERAADLVEQVLFARLSDPDAPPMRRDLAMSFIWRASAGGKPPTPRSKDAQSE